MKLSVWQTYVEAFDYCWRERAALVRFTAIPLVVVLALSLALQAFGFDQTAAAAGNSNSVQVTLAIALAGIVQTVVFLPMAVSWYRVVVFGRDEAARRPMFTLGRLEGRMLWWNFVIVIGAALAFTVTVALSTVIYTIVNAAAGKAAAIVAAGILGLPLLLMILVSTNRLGMVLVLVATDQPVSLKVAWALTRGVAWRLFAAVILVVLTAALFVYASRLVALLIGMIAAMTFNSTADAIVPYLALVGQSVSGLAMFLVLATLFGQIYRLLERLPASVSDDSGLPPIA